MRRSKQSRVHSILASDHLAPSLISPTAPVAMVNSMVYCGRTVMLTDWHAAGNLKRVFSRDGNAIHKWASLKDNVDGCLNEMQNTIQEIVETAVQQCLNTVAAGRAEISQLVEEQEDYELEEPTGQETPNGEDFGETVRSA